MMRAWTRRSIPGALVCVALAAVGAPIYGCGSAAAPRAAKDPERALRAEIARLEARRGASVDALAAMVPAAGLRGALAARALGRVGGPRAKDVLLAELSCSEACRPGQLAQAAAALGVMAALEEPEPDAVGALSTGLVSALERTTAADRLVVLEALGRAGATESQPALAARLATGGAEAQAAALALGRHGRRKLTWSEPVRAQVVAATASADESVRYAATWALAREANPPAGGDREGVRAALVARLRDAAPEVRAQAAAALGKRKLVAGAGRELVAALGDPDWRVVVEAARALGGEPDLAEALAEAATVLAQRLPTDLAQAQAVLEIVRQLAGRADRPAVAARLDALVARAQALAPTHPVLAGWLRCRAQAALERARPVPDLLALARCGGRELAPAYAAQVVAEVIDAGAGELAARRAARDELSRSSDPRVRAAALAVAPSLAAASGGAQAAAEVELVTAALGASDASLAAAAIEVAATLTTPGAAAPWKQGAEVAAALDEMSAAVVDRAGAERDPELAGALLDFISQRKLAAGAAACRAAESSTSPVIARAARRCSIELGATPAAASASPAAVESPPVELALAWPDEGKRWRWHITTDLGEVDIDLDANVAPWHVATVVALTRRGFYDGLEFHRVVPDFVVQGGDPSESGSGGPGFALPAEPGSVLDGDSYRAGAVGFADAGKDSGGSQWFAMHSRAPHLEGRYTRVGLARAGQPVLDALLIGNRVISARVTAE